jgi:DegV family protein with EDD domain
MKKIAIITDTDSSLPPAVAEQYGIQQVPITIHFDQDSYTTGVDINDLSLFEKVDQLKKLPTTSAPSPHAFLSAYEKAFENGADTIVCVCVSSKISATYNSAVTASELFPGKDINVIDSLSLSMGQGFMALAAAEAALNGANKEQVIEQVYETGKRIHLYAVLSTLKYLAMSGRVGKLVAGMADTLNIKPVLTVQEGKLELLERVRTRKKAVERMFELLQRALDGKGIQRAAMIHVNYPSGASELQDELCTQFAYTDTVITAEFTPGLSVHAGSGVAGLVVLAKK